MTERVEIGLAAALSALGIVLVLLGLLLREDAWQRRLRWALATLALVCAGSYVNFGTFHGRGLFPHYWEQFHYFLGAKYFPELGYDGLYVASMGAEMQDRRGGQFQPFLRDLRTNDVVPTATLESFGYEVYRRFTAERWAEFRSDNRFFMRLDPNYVMKVRMDHGYNPSPAWTALARLFADGLSAGHRTSVLLGALDLVLISLAFVVLFRTYGMELGSLALLVFATGFAWRWYWTGGGFLRQDWLAATVVAVCLLKRRSFFVAGLLFAYAAMDRVFPGAFLLGPAVVLVRDLVRGRDWRWFARLAAGFALGVAVLFAAGSSVGRGTHAWNEFAANLAKHRRAWLTNNVGLADVVLYGRETYGRELVQPNLPEPWIAWQARMDLLARERRPAMIGLALVLLGLAALAAWRARGPDEAAVLGVVAVFALALATCYYWGMLLLTTLRRPRVAVVGLLALNIVMCLLYFRTGAFEVQYGAMSWMLLLFFAIWLWPFGDARPESPGGSGRGDRAAEVTEARAGGRSRAARRAASNRP